MVTKRASTAPQPMISGISTGKIAFAMGLGTTINRSA
jgi:hypothetical protein